MSLTVSGSELAEAFGLDEIATLLPRYNIAPGQQVSVVRLDPARGRPTLASLLWGLVPGWAPGPATGTINARSETAASRPTFREPFRRRRCLVPASGFYEWKQEGGHRQPYFITRKDGRPMALAGLWDRWEGAGAKLESCAILTTDANDVVRPIHDRMPVILPPEDFDRWLDSREHDARRLGRLLVPSPPESLVAYPVSTLVNKADNDSPDCIEPMRETQRELQGSLW